MATSSRALARSGTARPRQGLEPAGMRKAPPGPGCGCPHFKCFRRARCALATLSPRRSDPGDPRCMRASPAERFLSTSCHRRARLLERFHTSCTWPTVGFAGTLGCEGGALARATIECLWRRSAACGHPPRACCCGSPSCSDRALRCGLWVQLQMSRGASGDRRDG